MIMPKQYADIGTYEAKLEKVMSRLGVDSFNYDWNRTSCWIEFFYRGQLYRFEHSLQNAHDHGINVKYGSDVFAQVVLSLEDLARMVERGIYELSTWVAGMKCLPAAANVPECFKILQFSTVPATAAEVKQRYRQIINTAHPDKGGTDARFIIIKAAYEEALSILGGGE